MDCVGNLVASDYIGGLEPSVDDVISQIMLQEMGASNKRHKR